VNVIRDESTGCVIGVQTKEGVDGKVTTIPADLIVSAAGCGNAASYLGGIPLLDRPGRIEYGRIETEKQDGKYPGTLKRILVDPERSSHVLQRSNGDIVAGGGGNLEFGGSKSTVEVPMGQTNKMKQIADEPISLLGLAKELVPSLISQTKVVETHHAVRPMPKDGLPVLGYTNQGVYTIVTHSAMTLGPLLTSLAIEEITTGISFEILDVYRPSRFAFQTESSK
jgi:glycine/D-amino acid oxidase-like deaminating enzyme